MKFRMLVVGKEEIEGSLVLSLNTINAKGRSIVRGRNSAYAEIWLPNFKSLKKNIIPNVTVLNVELTDDFEMTRKNLEKLKPLGASDEYVRKIKNEIAKDED